MMGHKSLLIAEVTSILYSQALESTATTTRMIVKVSHKILRHHHLMKTMVTWIRIEHTDDGDFLPAKASKRKKVPSGNDNINQKSKANSCESTHDTLARLSAVDGDNSGNENIVHVAFLRGKTRKLTGCNPFFISREVKKSFGNVVSIESRGQSLKITAKGIGCKL